MSTSSHERGMGMKCEECGREIDCWCGFCHRCEDAVSIMMAQDGMDAQDYEEDED